MSTLRLFISIVVVFGCVSKAQAQSLVWNENQLVYQDDTETPNETIVNRFESPPIPSIGLDPPLPPVNVLKKWYVANSGDLFVFDSNERVLNERFTYPGAITELRVEENKLFVHVNAKPEDVVFEHRGQPTFRGPWSSGFVSLLRPLKDIETPLVNEPLKSVSDHGKHLNALAKLESFDRTNPLIPAFIGFHLLKSDKDAAEEAFQRAFHVKSFWTDDVMLCGVFERANQMVLADKTCQRAETKMKARGVRKELLISMVLFVALTEQFRFGMSESFKTADVKSVDRIASRYFQLFPHVEGSSLAQRTLSTWFQDNDSSELSQKWADRIDDRAESFAGARIFDLTMLWFVCLMFTFPFAGFAAGVSRARTDASSRAEHGADIESQQASTGWRRWVAPPPLTHVLVLCVLVAVSILPLKHAAKAYQGIETIASAPLGLFQDGLGSPEVVQWFEHQAPPTDANFALGKRARAEFEATLQGVPVKRGYTTEEVRTAMSDGNVIDPKVVVSISWTIPLVLFGYVLFLIIGLAFGRAKLEKYLIFIPASAAGLMSAIVAMLILLPVLFKATPLGSLLSTIATPSFGKYFFGDSGPEIIVSHPVDQLWPWAMLAAGIVWHFASAAFAHRRAKA